MIVEEGRNVDMMHTSYTIAVYSITDNFKFDKLLSSRLR